MTRTPETTGFWQGRLPHWEVEDGRYFVTVHLYGAIPQSGLQRIQVRTEQLEVRASTRDESVALLLSRTIFREMEEWLDCVPNCDLLSQPPIAEMVMEAIEYRERANLWTVYEFVLMPSHLHLFLSVHHMTLKASLEGFKRWTGHRAAQLVELPQGRFWQDEWFDHWSRSDDQDERIVEYIRQNPVKAGLVSRFQDWQFGSWHP